MSEKIERSRLRAAVDPDKKLAELMGAAFGNYRQAWAEAERGRRPRAPLHLDVDVTTACNLRCPMCPAGNSGHNFPGFTKGLYLDFGLYRKALAEGAEFGLPSLRLGLTGEPLLLADIDRWVDEARRSGVLDLSLITNGQLLTPDLSRRLVGAGLTRLMISVDAASEEVYRRVRPGGDWGRLIDNIEAFAAIRDREGSGLPLLRLSFVEMTSNRSDRRAFEERFSGLADYLSFQSYQNILGAEDTEFGLESGRPKRRASGFCAEPRTRLALQADGGLFPCCSDFGRLRPLGNIRSGELLAIWNSEEALFLCGPEAAGAEPCRSCLARSSAR